MPLDPQTDILRPEINSLKTRESVLATPYAMPALPTITPAPLKGGWGWTWTLLIGLTFLAGVLRFGMLDRPTAWGDEARVWWRTSSTYQLMLERLRTAGFTPLHYTATWWITQGMPIWGKFETLEEPTLREGRREPGREVQALFTPERAIDAQWLVDLRTGLDGRTEDSAKIVYQVYVPWKAGTIKTGKDAEAIVREAMATPRKEFVASRPLLGKPITPTPFVLRIIPALSGTLMVPAMFWLAYQWGGRRLGLMAATLTCFSAYMLVYARDAKMYADLWLMVTLHLACLMWWLRSRLLLAWLCMLASGLAMIGIQLVSIVILGVDLLIVVTAGWGSWHGFKHLVLVPFNTLIILPIQLITNAGRPPWEFDVKQAFLWPTRGFTIPAFLSFLVAAGVIGLSYRSYDVFNRFKENTTGLGTAEETRDGPPGGGNDRRRFGRRSEERRDDQNPWTMDLGTAGIGWVQSYNWGRGGPSLLLYTASAYLTGWEWPREADQKEVPLRRLKLLKAASFTLIAAGLLGFFPWRRAWHLVRGRRIITDLESPVRPWRRTLWVGAWLVLPVYAWYVMSVPASASPDEMVAELFLKTPPNFEWQGLASNVQSWLLGKTDIARVDVPWAANRETLKQAMRLDNLYWLRIGTLAGLAGFAYMFCASEWRRRNVALIRVLTITLLLLIACAIVYLVAPLQRGSIWMPRYLGFVWPAFAIVFAWALLRLPFRPLRWGVVALFIIANMSQFGMRLHTSEPPTRQLGLDTIAAQSDRSTLMFASTRNRPGGPGDGTIDSVAYHYYVGMLQDRGTTSDSGGWRQTEGVQRTDPNGNAIPNRLRRRNGEVKQIIVWRDLDPTAADHLDPLVNNLGPEWKRASYERFHVYDHWRWLQMYDIVRTTYVFAPEPATQPTIEPPAVELNTSQTTPPPPPPSPK